MAKKVVATLRDNKKVVLDKVLVPQTTTNSSKEGTDEKPTVENKADTTLDKREE